MKSILVVPVLLVAGGIAWFLTRDEPSSLAATDVADRAAVADPVETAPKAGAPASVAQTERATGSAGPLRDAALEPFRRQLLDLAYTTASLVPVWPHVKTRSQLQEDVVVACFELEQLGLAQEYIEGIDNWRRGACYADVAYYLARRGRADDVPTWIDRAAEFVERMQVLEDESMGEVDDESVEGYQAWRKDRIRAKIARTYFVLGDEAGTSTFLDGLEASEAGLFETTWAEMAEAEDVPEQARVLAAVSGAGDFERVKNAVEVGLVLYGRFHGDADLRKLLGASLRACLDKSPVVYRMDGHLRMAAIAAARGDAAAARELVTGTEELLAETPLALEDVLPLQARIAALHWTTGERDAARALAATTLERYGAGRAKIESLVRADVLVPIAEAFVVLEDRERALETYRRAVIDGAENPNAVPRAADLSSTLVSMARRGAEPDDELWARIREIHAGLGDPW